MAVEVKNKVAETAIQKRIRLQLELQQAEVESRSVISEIVAGLKPNEVIDCNGNTLVLSKGVVVNPETRTIYALKTRKAVQRGIVATLDGKPIAGVKRLADGIDEQAASGVISKEKAFDIRYQLRHASKDVIAAQAGVKVVKAK